MSITAMLPLFQVQEMSISPKSHVCKLYACKLILLSRMQTYVTLKSSISPTSSACHTAYHLVHYYTNLSLRITHCALLIELRIAHCIYAYILCDYK